MISTIALRAPRRCAALALVVLGASGCIPDVEPSSGPSCEDLDDSCGIDQNESCCARSLPIAGGTFNRFDDPMFPAKVGPFVLDRFEVTVGRFRRFVADYPHNLPKAGGGALPGSPESGWRESWKDILPPDRGGLMAALKCDSVYSTWTDQPGPNEEKPINCITWYQAFAFCAWDGGRLPTQTEWSFAAVGGHEQRIFPWKVGPPDNDHALFGCTDVSACSTPLQPVGSRSPAGDGAFGQADLAGSLWEWTLDEIANLPAECVNCVDASYPDMPPPDDGFRVRLGGSWRSSAADLKVDGSNRANLAPYFAGNDLGIRCARGE